MISGARIILGTAVTMLGLLLVVLGGLGAGLLSWLLVNGRTTPVSAAILMASLGAFGAAAAWGGLTIINVVRNRLDVANRHRRMGIWALCAAVLIWILAAAVG